MEIYPLTKYKEKVVNDLVHVVQLKFMEIYSYEEKEKVMNGCPCSYNSKLFYATVVDVNFVSCYSMQKYIVAMFTAI
jgi:hypothetical protein